MGYRTTYLKKIARDIPGYFGLLISITKRVLFRLLAPYYLNYFLCRAPAFHMKSVVFRSRSFAFRGAAQRFFNSHKFCCQFAEMLFIELQVCMGKRCFGIAREHFLIGFALCILVDQACHKSVMLHQRLHGHGAV